MYYKKRFIPQYRRIQFPCCFSEKLLQNYPFAVNRVTFGYKMSKCPLRMVKTQKSPPSLKHTLL